MLEVTNTPIAVDELSMPGFPEFLAYWQGLCGKRLAPSWNDVELIDLPAKLVPYVTMVDVTPDGSDFVYRFIGTGHMATKARDYTARSVRSIRPGQMADAIYEQYRQTVKAAKPMAFVRTIRGFSEDHTLSQTTIRLPLSDKGIDVNGIMSLSDWRHQPEMRDFYVCHARNLQGGAPFGSGLQRHAV